MIINVKLADEYDDGCQITDIYDIGDQTIEQVTPVLEKYYARLFMPFKIECINESPRVEISAGIFLL